MKTKIIAFLKRYAILIGIVIFLLILLSIKNATIKRQTKKIVEIEQSNLAYNNDRLFLEKQIREFQLSYKAIKGSNDSLKKVLALYQLELSNLKKKHSQELAELVKIPNDTVFVRLQGLYMNYDNEPLKYPFSGFQIAQIYTTAISCDMIQQEYSLQGKSLESCLGLNTGYEKGISNLNSQISNLQGNISKADLQIENYNKEVAILNKRVNRKGVWNKILLGISATAVGIAVIK
jgi:chromosome segregation ATPase